MAWINRRANSENCTMDPETSQSITKRFRRVGLRLKLSRWRLPPVSRPRRMVRRKSSWPEWLFFCRLALSSPLICRVMAEISVMALGISTSRNWVISR